MDLEINDLLQTETPSHTVFLPESPAQPAVDSAKNKKFEAFKNIHGNSMDNAKYDSNIEVKKEIFEVPIRPSPWVSSLQIEVSSPVREDSFDLYILHERNFENAECSEKILKYFDKNVYKDRVLPNNEKDKKLVIFAGKERNAKAVAEGIKIFFDFEQLWKCYEFESKEKKKFNFNFLSISQGPNYIVDCIDALNRMNDGYAHSKNEATIKRTQSCSNETDMPQKYGSKKKIPDLGKSSSKIRFNLRKRSSIFAANKNDLTIALTNCSIINCQHLIDTSTGQINLMVRVYENQVVVEGDENKQKGYRKIRGVPIVDCNYTDCSKICRVGIKFDDYGQYDIKKVEFLDY